MMLLGAREMLGGGRQGGGRERGREGDGKC